MGCPQSTRNTRRELTNEDPADPFLFRVVCVIRGHKVPSLLPDSHFCFAGCERAISGWIRYTVRCEVAQAASTARRGCKRFTGRCGING